MRQKTIFIYLLLSVFFVLSCSKSTPNDDKVVDSERIEISDFYFDMGDNPTLRESVIPTEEGGVYTAQVSNSTSAKLVARYTTNAYQVFVKGVLQQSGVTENDFSDQVDYRFVSATGEEKMLSVKIEWGALDVPQIFITIAGNEEVVDKKRYLQATMKIDGNELYPDYEGDTEIRGRGNSTWEYDKKPYRLKLNTSSEILGLPAARNWVLLANYLDPSLMCNSVAMRIGQDLGVEYTNTTIPVDLTINGRYRGSYVLTQQIEEHENRVNIGSQGYLLELDTYFDEDYQFHSANYDLPVMIKAPKLEHTGEIDPIKADFEQFETLIRRDDFPNNNYGDYFDIDAFARYILVYFITGNGEVNHPKSTYIHKKPNGKFTFGPIWDFDWAYGYESSGSHFNDADEPQFWNGNAKGTVFFKRLFEDPAVQAAFKLHWTNYKTSDLNNLLVYIDEYADWIRKSKARDERIWNRGKDFETEVNRMKVYIQNRAKYIDSFVAGF